jgi:acetyl-CoA carboxylase biotin carboxyl carrier protein
MPEPTWADVLDLVARFDAAGYAEVRVERPGLRLYLSRTGDTSAAPGPASADTAARVTAPVLGVFYRRPAPDAPPFVEPGDAVDADTTVAIVEVMKLMNPVTAGIAGRIVAVCAEDGELVEEGQPLFLVDPGPGGGAS